MKTGSLSISIPAYNEEATIEELVRRSLETLSNRVSDWEVLVIDDGSRDATPAILERLAREDSRLCVRRHEVNLGFGATLKEVFQIPSKEAIFFIPGDAQIAPEELDRLLPALGTFDLILGRREERRDAWLRTVLSHGYNLLISLLLGRRVRDVDSVVLVKREVIRAIQFSADSAFLHAELLLKAARAGFSWTEIPISHRPRTGGASTVLKARTILPALRDLFRYLFATAEGERRV
ncbi:MAG: glycosyltransferase family 2 protein [Elusimicrobia bacterium]|nr:glycosyltransferase family 2 protein [Elusimicrobiota bacterium]